MSLLSRGITVIDAVSRSDQGLRFSEIADVLGGPSPTTVSKILKELIQEDILIKNAMGRYTLSRKVYFWGRAMAFRNSPIEIAKQHMERIHRDLKVSVNLFTCIEDSMYCLESIIDPESPSLWQAGRSLPIHIAILGALFYIPSARLHDEDFLDQEIQRHTYALSRETLLRMVDYAENTGVQDDLGAFYPGIYRFAVPLRDKGQAAMSLGVGVMPARLKNEEDLRERIISRLQQCQEEIEEFLN